MPLLSRRTLLGLGLAIALIAPAGAESWPGAPIRLVVPFPPGGGTDIIAREVANEVSALTKWNFVVDNKPGAGGNLGVDIAAKAAPTGYTLVIGQTSNLAINATLYKKLPYDPVKDLTPVSLVGRSALAIVVAASSPYHTLADVITAAKAHPGTLNVATSGNGTVAHMSLELLQKDSGARFTHIPYKGASQGLLDVIGGSVQLYISSVPTLIGQIRTGQLRALAVTSADRVSDLPQVPTVAESGYKNFEAVVWFGILGPAHLPPQVVADLNGAINKALQSSAVRSNLGAQGVEVSGDTPAQFGAMVQSEVAKWRPVVKASGAKID
ncbi:MAG: tripartite tricarboxylate transporter substrate binding protein [Burkholderiales bacterium]|nr:tripartite tricarboxylate transporter substrate binding protein [Burkholderiales bacterium]MDE2454970.1 tripartite tricarboxylate transporter substrate binding protein [Burkholderiales bacterium]